MGKASRRDAQRVAALLAEQRRGYLDEAARVQVLLDALEAGHGGEPHDESHSGDPEHPEEPRQPAPAAPVTAAREPSKQPRRTTRAGRRRGRKD